MLFYGAETYAFIVRRGFCQKRLVTDEERLAVAGWKESGMTLSDA